MRDRPPTQQNIAEALGLSRQVVSAILGRSIGDGGSVRYAPETRQRVLAEAQRQGYALAPTQARMAELHIIVADSLHVIPDGLLPALAGRAREHDVSLRIDVVPAGQLPRLIDRADAGDAVAVVFPLESNDCHLPRLRAIGVASLVVNCPTADGHRLDFDETQAGFSLVAWLVRARRRHLAFMYPAARVFSNERLAGLQAAAAAFPELAFSRCEHGAEAMDQAMASFLVAHPEVDAVLIEHPVMAPQLLRAIQQAGRRSEDIQVASFFSSFYLRALCPGAVCLDIRAEELAERILVFGERACRGERSQESVRWPYQLTPALACA